MTYFKVKTEADNKMRITTTGKNDGIWIADELLTAREAKKYIGYENKTEKVEVKKTDTYWAFGARFACS